MNATGDGEAGRQEPVRFARFHVLPTSLSRCEFWDATPPLATAALPPLSCARPMTASVAPPVAGRNLPEFTVSELSAALKRTVEDTYAHVRVRGEISGFKRHSSGHLYMALKDADAVLDAVVWRGTAGRLGLKPEDGMEVIATGRLTTYPGRSKYQIVIEAMELAGEGALLKLLEDRRKKLAAEGPVRCRAQAAAAVPAGSHRRRHLADRRRHPRHPASPARPLPAPCPALAGRGAGRGRRGPDRRRHRRLQRARARRPGAAPRSPDRRARRRQPRRPLGVQRGDRRARRRGLGDPARSPRSATRPTRRSSISPPTGARRRRPRPPRWPCRCAPSCSPKSSTTSGAWSAAGRASARRGACASKGWRAACPIRARLLDDGDAAPRRPRRAAGPGTAWSCRAARAASCRGVAGGLRQERARPADPSWRAERRDTAPSA